MVLQHEYQHNETILQTLQLKQGQPVHPARATGTARPGAVRHGAMPRRWCASPVDQSRSAPTIARAPTTTSGRVTWSSVSPFLIDVHPVTNREFLRFIAADGYETRECWSEAGWRWKQEASAIAPKYWTERDGAWITRTMDREGPVDPDHPVCHVSYYEAEAFARFAGKRLPTEIEWEAAASWEPAARVRRTYPWGETPPDRTLANLDQLSFGTAAVGAYPLNVSADRLSRYDRRRVGMDLERLRSLARVPELPVQGILRSLLRSRVQGSSRRLVGHSAWRGPQHLP